MSKDYLPGITAVERVWSTGSKSVVVANKNDHIVSCTDGFCHNSFNFFLSTGVIEGADPSVS